MNIIPLKYKDTIFSGLCLLLFLSFFLTFANAAKVIILGMVVLYSFGYNSFSEKWQLLKDRKYIWWMLAFAIYIIISAWLLSDNHQDAGRALEKRLPLLFFPLSIGLIRINKELRNKILLGFAIIVCICCFASLIYAISQYRKLNNSAWLYNDALSYLIRQQSIYTSLLVNISIYIFGYFIFFSSLSSAKKFWCGFAIFFLLIISYMLASRNMMLFLYLSLVIFVFYYILKRKKYLEGVTLLMGIFILVFLVYKFFPKTINRFKELAYTQFNYKNDAAESHYAGNLTAEQWNGANFRLAAWPCGWQVFKEHPVAGVGLGDKTDELYKVYRAKDFQFALRTEKNVHNNYLDILFSLGIVGFLLFITGWFLLPLIRFIRSRDGLAVLILITFLLAMISENYFDRSLGGMLFGFFIPFMLTGNDKLKNEKA